VAKLPVKYSYETSPSARKIDHHGKVETLSKWHMLIKIFDCLNQPVDRETGVLCVGGGRKTETLTGAALKMRE
jgi:hypothetical protein